MSRHYSCRAGTACDCPCADARAICPRTRRPTPMGTARCPPGTDANHRRQSIATRSRNGRSHPFASHLRRTLAVIKTLALRHIQSKSVPMRKPTAWSLIAVLLLFASLGARRGRCATDRSDQACHRHLPRELELRRSLRPFPRRQWHRQRGRLCSKGRKTGRHTRRCRSRSSRVNRTRASPPTYRSRLSILRNMCLRDRSPTIWCISSMRSSTRSTAFTIHDALRPVLRLPVQHSRRGSFAVADRALGHLRCVGRVVGVPPWRRLHRRSKS